MKTHGTMPIHHTRVDMTKNFRAELTTQPKNVQAGEPTRLRLDIKDSQGTFKDLEIVHEKPLHLLLVSDDLADFYHLHPDAQPDGSYRVTHTFSHGGPYKLYADFTPTGAAQVIEQYELTVAGSERPRTELKEDGERTKTVEWLRVTILSDTPLRAGREAMLTFKVADSVTGEPATDLQPYLGALAHFVIISEDTRDFLHAHPMEPGNMSGAMPGHTHKESGDSAHAQHAMAPRHDAQSNASPSEVSAHTTFPRAGLYKVWAQFQRDGHVITVPFVVRVCNVQPEVEDEGGQKMNPQTTTYACPMHPEVTDTKPGKCPKCGMNLEPVKSSSMEKAAIAESDR